MKFLAILLFSASAMAVDCGSEIEKLCKDRSSDFAACVKESVAKLPTECRKEVNGFGGMAEGLATSCMGDLMKYCPISMDAIEESVETASLKQAECLKKNKSKFSSECNTLLNKISETLGGSIEGGASSKKIR
ncbi:hypothetical protein [Halobacteriovorax sp.]|uniref:hypothetical protein n=1 Tax=Halobacteriovorax sp. TaxID=2020862 RepID=UPI0035683077